MTRLKIDTAPPAVRKFLRSLSIDANGIELELGGKVVCKLIPPSQLSEAQKAAALAEVSQLLGEAQDNSKRFPAAEVERKIRSALKTVRGHGEMLTAILDTNVFIRAALRPGCPSARVVVAYLAGEFQLVLSQAVLDELLAVLLLPEIREMHGWSDDKILRFVMNLSARAVVYPGLAHVAASVPRDVTDVKFLSLAQESGADYLVTKDGRHLLRLKKYGRTRIVTPKQFLELSVQ